ncbi:class I SAM-dependent methyltransferase [Pseudorhodobacter ferrugineus]|uniref:class I SAM-dependent methyltransferase n=1 Tax=Pseudorhodobacter ferrugineus TaxID=77008 RepID=UPI0003B52811|nr:methyltransferase [Pseudorhodobacter ferrugineus]
MRSDRLTFALRTDMLNLPDAGDILVLHPAGHDSLSMLPKGRLTVIQPMRPDYDNFVARGYSVLAERPKSGRFAAVLVCVPRAKAAAYALLAEAAAATGPKGHIIVDGHKTDGIDSLLRDLRARFTVSDPVSKAHGKLFSFRPGDDLMADWAAKPQDVGDGFQTLPGVFSADGPDAGSALLAATLPEKLGTRVIDLGAGWGYLSRSILTRPTVKDLHLVEANATALTCAKLNITDPRAQFHWADATTFKLDRGVDTVVCNPPFHTARDPDPALGLSFLQSAARLLASHGTLWLVANRHLPYDRTLAALFREVEDIGSDPRFRLTRAARPLRAPK